MSVCATCGVSLVATARFCHACGTPTSAAPASPRFQAPIGYTPTHLTERILNQRAAIEGERKRVTVLFCDLAGSTELAERLGPETMHEAIDRFFEIALEEVHHYEGTINQFLGDGFMALFGAPLAVEQHERQGVLAALAIQERLRRQSDLIPAAGTVRARMGLNTGSVVVGKIGDNLRMDYTAVGDTTNVAFRLQTQAEPGDIVVSASTWSAVRGLVATEPLGDVAVRGRSTPVTAHRILGRLPSRTTVDVPVDEPGTPFVGREPELASLMEIVAQVEAGRGQIVGVMGEAGLGKSRLLLELRRRLTGRRLTWLEGRCVSYGNSIPYLPIIEILRANCRIVESDAPEVAAGKVGAALSEVSLDAGTYGPYLLDLLGLKDGAESVTARGPETVRARTWEALRLLSLRGSRHRPLVFVIEDLHWADESSQQFIIDLADQLAGARIVLLTSYRPGYTPAWSGKSYATQLALQPLTERESREVVMTALAQSAAPELVEEILARGEGNPFFLEELARTLGTAREPEAAPAIPGTLLDVLTSRIDRLPEAAKQALQLAAVIGREFSARLLAETWPGDSALESCLQELVRLEFLYRRTLGEDVTYVFKHALTRDVAYAGLLERRRRRCHAGVGHALERLHVGRLPEVVETLAWHFGLSDEDEKAVDYALAAADKAQRRWANAEALAFSEGARRRLDALPDTDANLARRIDAVLRQAEVRFALGRHTEQIEALTAIHELVERVGDPARVASWHSWMGFLHILTGGRPDVAIAHCETGFRVAQEAGLEETAAFADISLAQAYLVIGDLVGALAAGERALGVFEKRGNIWWACRALWQLTSAANARGEWERSLAYCRRLVEHGVAVDDLRLKVSALVRTASTHTQRGDWRAGLRFCDEALTLQPTPFDAAAVHAVRGYAMVKAGNADGVREIEQALAWYDRSHLSYTRTLFAMWVAEGYLRLGDAAHAREVLETALTSARSLGYRHLEGVGERLFGEALTQEAPEAAGVHLEAAARRLEMVGARGELAKTQVAQALFAERCGDVAAARRLLAHALESLDALGSLDEPARVRAILDRLGAGPTPLPG